MKYASSFFDTTGDTGIAGITGLSGVTGLAGQIGIGVTGIDGLTGFQGTTGFTAYSFPTGLTQRASGSVGYTYSTLTTTAIQVNNGAAMVSTVLDIGKYWVSARSSYSNATGQGILGYFTLNGVSINMKAFTSISGANGGSAGVGGSIPVFITTNATTLAWNCYRAGGGGTATNPQHELWVMQLGS